MLKNRQRPSSRFVCRLKSADIVNYADRAVSIGPPLVRLSFQPGVRFHQLIRVNPEPNLGRGRYTKTSFRERAKHRTAGKGLEQRVVGNTHVTFVSDWDELLITTVVEHK
jgi:hypothetical protein